MRATEILAEEHRELFRVLDCFESLVERVERRGLEAALARDLLDFLERHVDGCHQDKEEKILFPKLMERTPAEMGAFLRALQGIHENERALLGEVRQHLEGAARGDARSLDRFVDSGRLYVSLQREHADREDRMLLPLADEVLGQADDAEMILGFRRIEQDLFGEQGGHMVDAVDALCARLDDETSTAGPGDEQGVA